MDALKAGDRVVCVDAAASRSWMQNGRTYVVAASAPADSKSFIIKHGAALPVCSSWRFRKYEAPAPEAASGEAAGDPVTLPHHYTRFKIEPIYFIMENRLSFEAGCVIKYVCRHDAKNGVEDLKKARRYLDMMIKKAEGDEHYAR